MSREKTPCSNHRSGKTWGLSKGLDRVDDDTAVVAVADDRLAEVQLLGVCLEGLLQLCERLGCGRKMDRRLVDVFVLHVVEFGRAIGVDVDDVEPPQAPFPKKTQNRNPFSLRELNIIQDAVTQAGFFVLGSWSWKTHNQ